VYRLEKNVGICVTRAEGHIQKDDGLVLLSSS
jgi:hypothetical protein